MIKIKTHSYTALEEDTEIMDIKQYYNLESDVSKLYVDICKYINISFNTLPYEYNKAKFMFTNPFTGSKVLYLINEILIYIWDESYHAFCHSMSFLFLPFNFKYPDHDEIKIDYSCNLHLFLKYKELNENDFVQYLLYYHAPKKDIP